jgi:hypothetical protein
MSNLEIEMCCKEIGQSTIIQDYFDNNKNNLIFDFYFGFALAEIPIEIILSDPLLNDINQKYKIDSGAILRLDPFRCYQWHVDDIRGVSINMLLTPNSKSMVLFGEISKESEDQLDIIEFKYSPLTLYWFNTQKIHTVINFEEPRYLFSIEF